jgi:hypothetical protein
MSLSLKGSRAYSLWSKKRPEKSASSPRTELYLRCNQLPLNIFIDCLIDNDLSGLVIRGRPTPEQLSAAWEDIYIEYIDLSQSAESLYSIRIQAEVTLLSDEIKRVEEILYFLSPEMLPFLNGRENELVEILRSYGYKQRFDFTTDYSKTIIAIRGRLNPKKLRLDSRLKEMGEYVKSKSNGKPSRSVFDTNLVRMSRFQGYSIRAKEITVAEYVMIFKDCITESKKENS